MRFLKKNFWTLSCLALVMVMAVSGNALADGNTLMGNRSDESQERILVS